MNNSNKKAITTNYIKKKRKISYKDVCNVFNKYFKKKCP